MPDVGLSMPRERRKTPEGFVRGSGGYLWELPEPMTRKEDAPCCQGHIDELGRPCIGFCGPFCMRRIERLDAIMGQL